MPDSKETRILKDINRHLAHIDEGAGMTDKLSPSEAAALNKNAGEIIGNFSSLISAETKDLINAGNKQLIEAFGNLKGFDTEAQADLLEDVVDELETSNRFASKAEHNDFLDEAEREEDLNINRRTNDLLEDLNEKEDAAASASAKAESGMGMGMGMGGLFGGLLAGKSIKGLLGAIKGGAKKLFFPALIALAGVEFLRGWAEAGEDASVMEKFKSGIGRTLSDLSFGLVSKDFFTNTMTSIEKAVGKAWTGFTKDWNNFVNGKLTAPDFFSGIISQLSLGTLSAEQIKLIGQQIEDGMVDVVATIVAAVTTGIVVPLMDALSDQFEQLFTDPVGFFKSLWADRKEKEKEDLSAKLARAKQLMKDEGLSESMAMRQATLEAEIEKQGFFTRFAGKAGLAAAKKLGAFSQTQAEADAIAAKKQAKDDIKAKRDEARRLRLEARLEETRAWKEERRRVKAQKAQVSNVGQEGLEQKIANERALSEFKRDQETGGGNAVQINQTTSVMAPVDRQTENDDLNLQRSSGLQGAQ
jgi:hypothetical protein